MQLSPLHQYDMLVRRYRRFLADIASAQHINLASQMELSRISLVQLCGGQA